MCVNVTVPTPPPVTVPAASPVSVQSDGPDGCAIASVAPSKVIGAASGPSARLSVSLAAVTVRPVTEPSAWIVFVPSALTATVVAVAATETSRRC